MVNRDGQLSGTDVQKNASPSKLRLFTSDTPRALLHSRRGFCGSVGPGFTSLKRLSLRSWAATPLRRRLFCFKSILDYGVLLSIVKLVHVAPGLFGQPTCVTRSSPSPSELLLVAYTLEPVGLGLREVEICLDSESVYQKGQSQGRTES